MSGIKFDRGALTEGKVGWIRLDVSSPVTNGRPSCESAPGIAKRFIEMRPQLPGESRQCVNISMNPPGREILVLESVI